MVYQSELHDQSDGSANAHRVPQQLFVYIGDLGVQLIEIQKRLSFVCGRGRRVGTGGIGIRLVEERCVHRGGVGIICRYQSRSGKHRDDTHEVKQDAREAEYDDIVETCIDSCSVDSCSRAPSQGETHSKASFCMGYHTSANQSPT